MVSTGSNPNGTTGLGLTNDAKLLNDFFFASNGSAWSADFSGLQNGVYDVYNYAPTNTTVTTGDFSIHGINQDKLSASISTLVQGQSWDVLSGLNVTNGEINFFSAGTGADWGGLAGVQIVSPQQHVYSDWERLDVSCDDVGDEPPVHESEYRKVSQY